VRSPVRESDLTVFSSLSTPCRPAQTPTQTAHAITLSLACVCAVMRVSCCVCGVCRAACVCRFTKPRRAKRRVMRPGTTAAQCRA
jgi:hypothetical protein